MAVYLICYVLSFVLARQQMYLLSGLVLITAALWLYYTDYRKSHNLIHLRGLFCLSFVGGQGISCFKLSRLQTDWSLETWICLWLSVVCFWTVYEAFSRHYKGKHIKGTLPDADISQEPPIQEKRLLKAMAGLVGVSFAAFFFEAWKLGFVPLFSYGVPHAYSYFHVSGVHYFTVSCVLAPSLFVVYCHMAAGRVGNQWGGVRFAAVCTALSLAVPILCVSRFQLILAVGMAVFTHISMAGVLKPVRVAGLMAAMLLAYLALTVMRSHSVEYLNGIFEMKNQETPIFITQPYMYVANNYDNFNCLVNQLPAHSMGLKMLFPLWAFTGLKFIVPSLVDFQLFVTKTELTTVTLFYDAYYDFGALGMAAFSAVLGAACWYLSRRRDGMRCPVGHVVYAQIAMYMALAFFTTWFSNPATWFYLGVTGGIYLYVKGVGVYPFVRAEGRGHGGSGFRGGRD